MRPLYARAVITRERLAGDLEPDRAVLHLRGDRRPVAFVGEWAGVRAVLSSCPQRTAPADTDPFALLGSAGYGPADPVAPGAAAVGGGWFGWLGYPLGASIEELPCPPPAPVSLPTWSLAFHDHVVVCDDDGWWFEALVTPEREAFLGERLDLWRRRMRAAPAASPAQGGLFAPVAPAGAGHTLAVADAVRRIAAGELFQANLCLRIEGPLQGDPLDLFARALPAARPRFGAYLGGPAGAPGEPAVISLSPERFLRRTGRHVESDPVKGTAEDAATLSASAKDAAEHVMIVDLMRNDLGRVCAYGSVVASEPRVEAAANVFHLVSTVAGELREGADDAALLRAAFPPGSVTGAPKVQAMKTISWLEATARGVYTGAIGYASPVAGLELSVAIRTFETAGGRIWLGAGGGIVADSDPQAELDEALAKAAGPIEAIGGRLDSHPAIEGRADVAMPPQLPRRVGRFPRALDHGPRPDPAHGVMETLLGLDGVPQRLAEHLERLARSLAELYDEPLAPGAAALVAQAARGIPRGPARIRIEATRAGLTVRAAAVTAPAAEAGIAPYLLPGGLGAHKWLDRRLAAALAAATPTGSVAILVDGDGCVLEAVAANLWIAEGDTLITPPADGRILAGVTRARLLAEPRAHEQPLTLERLEAAERVLLSSAVAGLRELGQSPSWRA